ncbi:hypothetical protein M0657_009194 [Pyricularia oryzae]|uniref:Uncharacterized protein n=2 Tax=Pyricularia oryzae TaxID=318829 RepID=A0AA97NYM4_PYRO3|nr:hypothetical protein OOU_Y34scaffold00528g72 [Pyricularia oryzae Y34]KAI7915102.1 hypothetical protein M0657_009194 [Pyricularia oryzae]KAI7917785.1 hypothetical protein M9X92_007255 [Pyricularia oryzae]
MSGYEQHVAEVCQRGMRLYMGLSDINVALNSYLRELDDGDWDVYEEDHEDLKGTRELEAAKAELVTELACFEDLRQDFLSAWYVGRGEEISKLEETVRADPDLRQLIAEIEGPSLEFDEDHERMAKTIADIASAVSYFGCTMSSLGVPAW